MKNKQPQSSCKLRCSREKFKAQLSELLKFADEISQQAAFPVDQIGLSNNCNRWLTQAKTLMTDSFTSDYFCAQMIAKNNNVIDNGPVSNLCQMVRLQAEYLRGLETQINSIPVSFCGIIRNLFCKKTMIFITLLTLLFGFTTNAWAWYLQGDMPNIGWGTPVNIGTSKTFSNLSSGTYCFKIGSATDNMSGGDCFGSCEGCDEHGMSGAAMYIKINKNKDVTFSVNDWKVYVTASDPATGYTFDYPYIYFLNSQNWANCGILYGRGWNGNSYTKLATMTKVPNTSQLYYKYVEDYWNNNFNQIAVINASGWPDEANKIEDRYKGVDHTGIKYEYSFNKNDTYYISSTGSDNIEISASGVPTYTATIKVKKSEDGGSTYSTMSSGTWPATITLKGTAWTGTAGQTQRTEVVKTSGEKAEYETIPITGQVDMTMSSLNAAYEFKGWGTNSAPSETTNPKSYNITANTTYYAFFALKQFTITFGAGANGSIGAKNGSTTITSGSKQNYGSNITFTATPNPGYVVEGWYSDADFQNKIDAASTNTTYTINSITEGKTVYVKFKTQEYAVTFGVGSDYTSLGSVTASVNNGDPIDAGEHSIGASSKIVFTASPITGYHVAGWYSDPTCSQEITGAGTGTSYTIESLSKAETVYVKFEANTYKVHFDGKGNTSGSMSNQSFTYDEGAKALTTNAFKKTGYTFKGWDTNSAGTTVVYTDGQTVQNLTDVNNATIDLYAVWQINTYTLTLPDTTTDGGTKVCNFKIDSVKPASEDGTYNYNTPIKVYLSPKDGYRLAVTATYNDGSEKNLPLTHEDFSFLYTFNMPAGDATISVEPKEYKIGGDWDSWANKESFPANSNKIVKHFNAGEQHKFKIWNDTYHHTKAQLNDHYMGTEGQWEVWETTAGCVVTCEGQECFNLNVGITGDYTFTIGTSTDNKPMINIAYPDESYIEYNNTKYYFEQYGNTDKFISKGIPFPNAGEDYTATLVWNGSYYMNDNDNKMTSDSHTDWGYKIESNHQNGIKIRTTSQAKAGDKYYFIFDPKSYKEDNVTKRHLTAVYPSYIAGSWTNWAFTQPLSFEGDIATYTHKFTAEEKKNNIEFKIVYEGKWYSVASDGTFTGNASKILSPDDKYPNMTLTPNALDDEYTFTFNDTTQELTVYYPEANKYKVQVSVDGTNFVEKEIGSTSGIMIHAASKAGYRFTGWETTGDMVLDKTAQTTNVKANSVGTVKATYTNEGFVYFRDPNKSFWGKAHAYFYSGSYWDNNKGSGSKNIQHGPYGMAKLEGSDDNNPIYYFDYKSNFTDWTANIIAFTNNYCQGSDNFNMVQAAYRGDFNSSLPMYVPRNFKTHYLNSSEYYNEGIWMKFNDKESGYDLRGSFNNWVSHVNKFIASEANVNNFDFYTTVYLEAGKVYNFLIYNANGTQYGCPNQTIKTKTDGEHGWKFYESQGNCKITANVSGDYTFHISLKSGEVILYVTYPMESGDYRVNYGTEDNIKYSNVIKGGNASGPISLWLPNGTTILNFEKITSITDEGVITWESGKTIDVTTTAAGVYQMTLTSAGEISGGLTAYTGDYFVRTDCADGGWKDYLTNPDNKMHFTDRQPNYVADKETGYNYYYTKFFDNADGNVRFVIADTINSNLSGIMKGDEVIGDKENLPGQEANIRFTWNSNTNAMDRAYISGSTDVSKRYLVLNGNTDGSGNSLMLDENGSVFPAGGVGRTNLEKDEAIFTDKGNWVYQIEIKAKPGCAVKLMADYNSKTQYFIGAAGEESGSRKTIMAGTTEGAYKIRAVYDFKTDILVAGWIPDNETIEGQISLGGDMLLIRNGQGKASQIKFGDAAEAKVSNVQQIYGVLELNKEHMTNLKDKATDKLIPLTNNSYDRCMYWISFPFRVQLSKVFGGVDGYGTKWIMQKYDGQLRADVGWFSDSPKFWKYMGEEEYMEPYVGYVLCLSAKYFDEASDEVWQNVENVAFYFPSEDKEIDIISSASKKVTVPAHPCGINVWFGEKTQEHPEGSLNHTNTDSHWNVIGIPAFEDLQENIGEGGKIGLNALYEWNPSNNGYVVKATSGTTTYTFEAMKAYMVQFCGDIEWSNASVINKNVASAPRYAYADNKNYTIDLYFSNGVNDDHTYIKLADEASTDFVLNEDLMKIDNAGYPNIYSFAGAYNVAYNETKMIDQVVTIGVSAPADGSYTFSMPKDFSGKAVLVDLEDGTATDLNVSNYSVDLNKGTYNNRFQLMLKVEASTPTNIDNVDGGEWNADGKTKKLFINDQIYLINGGRIYNATGVQLR